MFEFHRPEKFDQEQFSILNGLLEYLKTANNLTQENKVVASKIIECIKFIKVNVENIVQLIEKPQLQKQLSSTQQQEGYIRDHNNTAIHYGVYKDSKVARAQLILFVEQIEHAIECMCDAKLLDVFVKKFEIDADETMGCIEKRTASALAFAQDYEAFKKYNEENKTSKLKGNFFVFFELQCQHRFTEDPEKNLQLVYDVFEPHIKERSVFIYLDQEITVTKDFLDEFMESLGQKPDSEAEPSNENTQKSIRNMTQHQEELKAQARLKFLKAKYPNLYSGVSKIKIGHSLMVQHHFAAKDEAAKFLEKMKKLDFFIGKDVVKASVTEKNGFYVVRLSSSQFENLKNAKDEIAKQIAVDGSEIYTLRKLPPSREEIEKNNNEELKKAKAELISVHNGDLKFHIFTQPIDVLKKYLDKDYFVDLLQNIPTTVGSKEVVPNVKVENNCYFSPYFYILETKFAEFQKINSIISKKDEGRKFLSEKCLEAIYYFRYNKDLDALAKLKLLLPYLSAETAEYVCAFHHDKLNSFWNILFFGHPKIKAQEIMSVLYLFLSLVSEDVFLTVLTREFEGRVILRCIIEYKIFDNGKESFLKTLIAKLGPSNLEHLAKFKDRSGLTTIQLILRHCSFELFSELFSKVNASAQSELLLTTSEQPLLQELTNTCSEQQVCNFLNTINQEAFNLAFNSSLDLKLWVNELFSKNKHLILMQLIKTFNHQTRASFFAQFGTQKPWFDSAHLKHPFFAVFVKVLWENFITTSALSLWETDEQGNNFLIGLLYYYLYVKEKALKENDIFFLQHQVARYILMVIHMEPTETWISPIFKLNHQSENILTLATKNDIEFAFEILNPFSPEIKKLILEITLKSATPILEKVALNGAGVKPLLKFIDFYDEQTLMAEVMKLFEQTPNNILTYIIEYCINAEIQNSNSLEVFRKEQVLIKICNKLSSESLTRIFSLLLPSMLQLKTKFDSQQLIDSDFNISAEMIEDFFGSNVATRNFTKIDPEIKKVFSSFVIFYQFLATSHAPKLIAQMANQVDQILSLAFSNVNLNPFLELAENKQFYSLKQLILHASPQVLSSLLQKQEVNHVGWIAILLENEESHIVQSIIDKLSVNDLLLIFLKNIELTKLIVVSMFSSFMKKIGKENLTKRVGDYCLIELLTSLSDEQEVGNAVKAEFSNIVLTELPESDLDQLILETSSEHPTLLHLFMKLFSAEDCLRLISRLSSKTLDFCLRHNAGKFDNLLSLLFGFSNTDLINQFIVKATPIHLSHAIDRICSNKTTFFNKENNELSLDANLLLSVIFHGELPPKSRVNAIAVLVPMIGVERINKLFLETTDESLMHLLRTFLKIKVYEDAIQLIKYLESKTIDRIIKYKFNDDKIFIKKMSSHPQIYAAMIEKMSDKLFHEIYFKDDDAIVELVQNEIAHNPNCLALAIVKKCTSQQLQQAAEKGFNILHMFSCRQYGEAFRQLFEKASSLPNFQKCVVAIVERDCLQFAGYYQPSDHVIFLISKMTQESLLKSLDNVYFGKNTLEILMSYHEPEVIFAVFNKITDKQEVTKLLEKNKYSFVVKRYLSHCFYQKKTWEKIEPQTLLNVLQLIPVSVLFELYRNWRDFYFNGYEIPVQQEFYLFILRIIFSLPNKSVKDIEFAYALLSKLLQSISDANEKDKIMKKYLKLYADELYKSKLISESTSFLAVVNYLDSNDKITSSDMGLMFNGYITKSDCLEKKFSIYTLLLPFLLDAKVNLEQLPIKIQFGIQFFTRLYGYINSFDSNNNNNQLIVSKIMLGNGDNVTVPNQIYDDQEKLTTEAVAFLQNIEKFGVFCWHDYKILREQRSFHQLQVLLDHLIHCDLLFHGNYLPNEMTKFALYKPQAFAFMDNEKIQSKLEPYIEFRKTFLQGEAHVKMVKQDHINFFNRHFEDNYIHRYGIRDRVASPSYKYYHLTNEIEEYKAKPKEKKIYTQTKYLSTTQLSPEGYTAVFGFNNGNQLLAIVVKPKAVKARLKRDSATVFHEWLNSSYSALLRYQERMEHINFTDPHAFVEYVTTQPYAINEVLSALSKENLLAIAVSQPLHELIQAALSWRKSLKSTFKLELPICLYDHEKRITEDITSQLRFEKHFYRVWGKNFKLEDVAAYPTDVGRIVSNTIKSMRLFSAYEKYATGAKAFLDKTAISESFRSCKPAYEQMKTSFSGAFFKDEKHAKKEVVSQVWHLYVEEELDIPMTITS